MRQNQIKEIAQKAIEAAKAAHKQAAHPRKLTAAHEAARATLIAEGGVLTGEGRSALSHPICGDRTQELVLLGAVITLDGGYSSNSPQDVWDYVRVLWGEERLASTGRLAV